MLHFKLDLPFFELNNVQILFMKNYSEEITFRKNLSFLSNQLIMVKMELYGLLK